MAYGTPGIGNTQHLSGELFNARAGTKIVHVPYKGDAPAIADLIAGQIQMYFVSLLPVVQHVKTGRLKALAVSSGSTFPLAPELPTVTSSGLPGFASFVWNGIVAPGRTPVVLVDRLQGEIARALALPEIREKMLTLGVEPVGSTPAEFRTFIAAEIKRSAKIVSEAGVRID
jgi:tripartite-type tricarboxylate transporter receptor subunit TctC